MSRKSKHQSNQSLNKNRDTFDIATDSEVVRNFIKKQTLTPRLHLAPPTFKTHQPMEDRRAFHPDGKTKRPIDAVPRSAARLKVAPASVRQNPLKLPGRVAFTAPNGVAVCVRRKNRREVLFALNRTKKGAGSPKRRNSWSDVKC